jgi:hypothetical protein
MNPAFRPYLRRHPDGHSSRALRISAAMLSPRLGMFGFVRAYRAALFHGEARADMGVAKASLLSDFVDRVTDFLQNPTYSRRLTTLFAARATFANIVYLQGFNPA